MGILYYLLTLGYAQLLEDGSVGPDHRIFELLEDGDAPAEEVQYYEFCTRQDLEYFEFI